MRAIMRILQRSLQLAEMLSLIHMLFNSSSSPPLSGGQARFHVEAPPKVHRATVSQEQLPLDSVYFARVNRSISTINTCARDSMDRQDATAVHGRGFDGSGGDDHDN